MYVVVIEGMAKVKTTISFRANPPKIAGDLNNLLIIFFNMILFDMNARSLMDRSKKN